MHDPRCLRATATAALGALAFLAVPPASSAPQWAPVAELPGGDRVEKVRRPGGDAGRLREVRWSPDGKAAWFQYAGQWRSVSLADGTGGTGEPPAAAEEPKAYAAPRGGRAQQAAQVPSPDGAWNAVFEGCNLRLVPEAGGEAVQVTTEGAGKRWFGSADWVYGEELDQVTAMWWSPDSARIAYYDFDESRVPDFTLLSGLASARTKPVQLWYPKPGDPNPVARLEVYELASRRRVPVDVGPDREQYVYGVQWSPKGDALLWFRAPRRQDRVELMVTDPATGASRALVTEVQETWQENSPSIRFLSDGRRFLWESESNGFSNLELWDLRDGKVARLTDDPWVVEGIVHVDERDGWVYYAARSGKVPICSQFHRARLDGSARERLTRDELHHSALRVSPDGTHFAVTSEFVDVAPSTSVFSMDGRRVAELAKAAPDPYAKAGILPPEYVECPAADGRTVLCGLLYRPSGFDPSKRYPLVVEAYGGPGVATVGPRFGTVEAAVEHGFLVAKVDNRGTPGRGKAFEGATFRRLGGPDVDDQAAFVRALAARPYVDAGRVAVCGHSYGGYMALMCALRHPGTFPVAVAGAPPTDWRQYDTIYTERYMLTPAENAEGYEAGSAVHLAKGLRSRVLLLHGMVDDNVHPTNTFALAAVLQQASIPFEMMLFPNAAHGIGSPAYDDAKWGFIMRNLGMWDPPVVGSAAPDGAAGGAGPAAPAGGAP